MPFSLSQSFHVEGCPPVTLERRAGQRNLRIRVKPDQVIVSGPRLCSKADLIAFLNDRLEWIRKTTSRLEKNRSSLYSLMQENRGRVYLRGEWIPLVPRHARPDSDSWLLSDRQTRVDVYPPEGTPSPKVGKQAEFFDALPRATYEEGPLTTLEVPEAVLLDFLRALAKKQLTAEFETLAAQLPFQWSRLFIRSQKTKWGTCSSKGNISLNWRLIKCPEHIRRYIMIHELCHTVYLNHSKAYWTLVNLHYPDVKQAHQWLKEYGELVFA